MKFDLKKPCDNCPFRKEGAISLARGRLAGIVKTLKDDHNVFYCHKSVHHRKGGDWTDEGEYKASGNEQVCPGSLAFMYRLGYLPITARLAIMHGDLTKEELAAILPLLKEKITDATGTA